MIRILAAAALILLAPPALAQGREQISTYDYDVYASGFHVMDARMTLTTRGSDYAVALTARTRGILGKAAPWHGRFESRGRVEGDAFVPAEHVSVSVSKGEAETRTYDYAGREGLAALTVEEAGRVETPELDPALTRGTTDVLSATLGVMAGVARGAPCTGAHDVFDGRRRFALTFRDRGAQALGASRRNIYAGPAATCVVEVVPKGGRWREKPRGWMSIQEQGRELGTMPMLWMAGALATEGQPLAVPVRVVVKTEYGALYMHLVAASPAPDGGVAVASKQ